MTDVKCFKRQFTSNEWSWIDSIFTSSRWVWNDRYLQADDSLTHRFMVPRMLPPTPFVGNSDILVPSPMVSFILTFPKQPQSTEKENENMPLSRMRVFLSFTPWPCPDQTSGSSDNCRMTDVNLESQVTDPPQVRTYRCVESVVKRWRYYVTSEKSTRKLN